MTPFASDGAIEFLPTGSASCDNVYECSDDHDVFPWLTPPAPELVSGIRATSLGKLVRDELLALILRGVLAPGQRINEPDIATRLGVSRVPVREALRELESSGLVAARKHAGVFVRVLEPQEVADLSELRGVLEAHAGRRAAGLGNAPRRALVAALNRRLGDMKSHAARQDLQGYREADLAFHWTLVESTGNEALAASYRGVAQQLHLFRLQVLSRDVGIKASLAEHQRIIAAIAAGDEAQAEELLSAHVAASLGRLRDRLAPDSVSETSQRDVPPTPRIPAGERTAL